MRQLLKRRSLSGQIFTYFLIVIVISLATVGIFSYWQSSTALDDQAERFMEQLIQGAGDQTDVYLQTYELLNSSFSSNSDVRNFFEVKPEQSYEYYYYSNLITKFAFDSVQSIPTLYRQLKRVYLLNPYGKSVSYENQLGSIDPALFEGKYEYLMKTTPDNGRMILLNMSIQQEDAGSVVTMARKVRGASYESYGIVAVEFRLHELAKIWERVSLGSDGRFFILDDAGNFLYRSKQEQVDMASEAGLAERILEAGSRTFTSSYAGEDRIFVARTSEYSNWNLVASMPVDELRRPVATIRTTTLAVGLLTLIAALWLAYRFGQSILRPIRELKDGMRQTEKGNWQHITESGRVDELGGLIRSYNLMVTRLSEMIEKVYESELHQQKQELELQQAELERWLAEFQSLQLQINPHFLYNTLETINCYAIVQDSKEITEMVEAMAFMLRYSIQTNLEEITVANELNHVRNYLIILQHRIGREFELDVVIPPELLLEKMVRLTLQPVIENIFQHAFPEGLEPEHYIRINARKGGGLFEIVVEDNGAGISPERLEELRERLRNGRLSEEADSSAGGRRGGIGLLNVHRRIQMVFGEQYGLVIESELGKGSRLTMRMPESSKPQLRK
jgi:two-component system, sensor histidine kinase YesM